MHRNILTPAKRVRLRTELSRLSCRTDSKSVRRTNLFSLEATFHRPVVSRNHLRVQNSPLTHSYLATCKAKVNQKFCNSRHSPVLLIWISISTHQWTNPCFLLRHPQQTQLKRLSWNRQIRQLSRWNCATKDWTNPTMTQLRLENTSSPSLNSTTSVK